MFQRRIWASPVPLGSIVGLTIDNGDGGRGIVLGMSDGVYYEVYRFETWDRIRVHPVEMVVEWSPDELSNNR